MVQICTMIKICFKTLKTLYEMSDYDIQLIVLCLHRSFVDSNVLNAKYVLSSDK